MIKEVRLTNNYRHNYILPYFQTLTTTVNMEFDIVNPDILCEIMLKDEVPDKELNLIKHNYFQQNATVR